VKASLLGSSISDSPGFEDCDGEEDDDDGARRTKAFTTVKKMMMTVQERDFPGNFGIASGVALPFLPMPKGI